MEIELEVLHLDSASLAWSGPTGQGLGDPLFVAPACQPLHIAPFLHGTHIYVVNLYFLIVATSSLLGF